MSKQMVPSICAVCSGTLGGLWPSEGQPPQKTPPSARRGFCCSRWNFLVSRGSRVHLRPRDSEGELGRGREDGPCPLDVGGGR